MLSENLRSLADRLRPYAATGMRIQPSDMTMVCAIIEAAVDDAEELEARTVPIIDRQPGALPANVVHFKSGAKP